MASNLDMGNLPPVIDQPYPFVAIGDLYEVAATLDSSVRPKDVVHLEEKLDEIKREFAPPDSTFYYTNAADLSRRLETMAEAEAARTDKRVGVVHLDKYIGALSCGDNLFRLDVSRNTKDELAPRVGTQTSVEEQLAQLSRWASEGAFSEVVLVDDVLAFGSTVPPLVERLREQAPGIDYRLLVGIAASGGVLRGIEKVREDTGIETEYLTRVHASPAVEGGSRGMTIPVSRDLTLLGGKTGTHPTGVQLSYPYFLPFAKPMPSLVGPGKGVVAAESLLPFNTTFANFLGDRLGREVTIGDIVDNSFGVPHSSLESVKDQLKLPTASTTLKDYLGHARDILEREQQAILDEIAA